MLTICQSTNKDHCIRPLSATAAGIRKLLTGNPSNQEKIQNYNHFLKPSKVATLKITLLDQYPPFIKHRSLPTKKLKLLKEPDRVKVSSWSIIITNHLNQPTMYDEDVFRKCPGK